MLAYPRHLTALTLGLSGFVRFPAHQDRVEPCEQRPEVDLRLHRDPVGFPVRTGNVPIQAHRHRVHDLSHRVLPVG